MQALPDLPAALPTTAIFGCTRPMLPAQAPSPQNPQRCVGNRAFTDARPPMEKGMWASSGGVQCQRNILG
jgi:hypothetical protein